MLISRRVYYQNVLRWHKIGFASPSIGCQEAYSVAETTNKKTPSMIKSTSKTKTMSRRLCAGGIFLSGATMVLAQDADSMAKENQDLKARVTALEQLAQKEGLLPSGSPSPRIVTAMTDLTVSGFVQASYFYNTRRPSSGYSDSYLWNTKDNSFSINKFKVTLASKPVATDKWDAGFKASLMFGDDAPALNIPGSNGTGAGSANTTFNDLREAYIELNVPVGTGLNIKAGQLISLLNYESGDGGSANVNFSEGNQWWYTGNGPSAGIQATYNFTDKVGFTARVDNGLFQGPVDNNQGKAVSGSLNLKPLKDLWINFIGWYDDQPNNVKVAGGSSIGGYQVTEKLGTGYEVDYFNNKTPSTSSDLWSVGGWIWYDFTAKVGLALRADFIGNPDGVLGTVRPGTGTFTPDTSGNLGSVTLTLNFKPTPALKIQPEIRYDYTTYDSYLNGKKDRIIVGCGATYMF